MIHSGCLSLAESSANLQLVLLSGTANLLLACFYFIIAALIGLGLWRNRDSGIDPFAAITAGLFWSGSWGHALRAVGMLGIRHMLGWQTAFDVITLVAAIAFLALRNRYSLLIGSTQVLDSQKQLQKRNAELEKKIDRRTQELKEQNQRLNSALAELQQINLHLVQTEKMSMLGQMVSGISHEINNPINFIHGNLPYVEEHIQGLLAVLQAYQTCYPQPSAKVQTVIEDADLAFVLEDLPRTLTSIRLGTERICELVLNLRNFYRLDEAEMKLADLEAGIESTLVLLQNRYKQKIEITRQFSKIPQVECHINQLNQVFMNLVSNSIDALLEEELSANSCLASQSAAFKQILITTDLIDASRVRIRIADNGPGMPADVQAHLFEPFFTTKPRGIGTGLGLSICHQIITETHQGRIYCCSAPGEGTTFAIELPIRQQSETVEVDRATAMLPATVATAEA